MEWLSLPNAFPDVCLECLDQMEKPGELLKKPVAGPKQLLKLLLKQRQ
jgi:hypothetical protein